MKARYSSLGAHFFDRSTGLNVVDDTQNIPSEQWSTAPRYVSMALTNACDLSCEFCYAAKKPSRLLYSNVLQWAATLDENGCLGLGLGGGEPTLYPNFSQLCQDLASTTNLAITFTTHGHRLTHGLTDELTGSVHFIRLSMDGIGATYESIRGRSFQDFETKIGLARSICRFGINYVVNDQTIDDLAEAADFALEVGASELLILPEVAISDRPVISKATIDRLSSWVADNWRSYPLCTSNTGAKLISAPVLPVNDLESEMHDILHIDAFSTLKPTAFSTSGIQLSQESSLLDTIRALRAD